MSNNIISRQKKFRPLLLLTTLLCGVGVSVHAANLKWSGSLSAVWNVGSTANWLDGATPATYQQGDAVLFDDSANGANTSINIASAMTPASVTVNNSSLNYAFGGIGKISGNANLVKSGNKSLTLSTANDLLGTVTVNDGTLVLGNVNALSATAGINIIGGTLDIGGYSALFTPITVSGSGFDGNGAIFNSGADVYGLANSITLANDATFGGISRWDIDSVTSASLSTGGQPYNLTITGMPYVKWHNVNVDSALGNIDVMLPVQFEINSGVPSLGDPTKTITIHNGAQVIYWGGNQQDKILAFEQGAQLRTFGTNRTFNYSIVLNGIIDILVGDGTQTFNGVISGPGGFNWFFYNNQIVMTASNTYAGRTLIGSGRTLKLNGNGSISHSAQILFEATTPTNSVSLDVSGRNDGTFTLASGQLLNGQGKITGKLTVNPGATVSPGDATNGVITASDNVTLNGTTEIKLNKTSGKYSLLSSQGTLTYGGVLSLTNQSGSYALNDSFKIFSAASYAGSFSGISPASPGAGLAWDTSSLAVNGTLKIVAGSVVSSPRITTITAGGGNVTLTGTNGAPSGTYGVFMSTNAALARSNWSLIGTGSFNGSGNFNFTTNNQPASRGFYYLRVP